MEAEGYTLQDLDLVVEAFAEAIGLAVLPAVLDVAPPVADGTGGGVDLLHIGDGILFDPFCQLFGLDRVGGGSKDIMEELEGFIGFQKIRSHFKGIMKPLLVFVETSAPVSGLIIFLGLQEVGLQEADDTFYLFRVLGVPGILELPLIAESHSVHHFIKTLDDVEGIDTDPGIREILPGDRDKTIAHVTAEVFYMFSLFQ